MVFGLKELNERAYQKDLEKVQESFYECYDSYTREELLQEIYSLTLANKRLASMANAKLIEDEEKDVAFKNSKIGKVITWFKSRFAKDVDSYVRKGYIRPKDLVKK